MWVFFSLSYLELSGIPVFECVSFVMKFFRPWFLQISFLPLSHSLLLVEPLILWMLVYWMLSHKSLKLSFYSFAFFSFCYSDWIDFSTLSVSFLILPSASSSLLLNSSLEFSPQFPYYILQLCGFCLILLSNRKVSLVKFTLCFHIVHLMLVTIFIT